MKLFFSLSLFAFTVILALIAFTFTTIYFPTTMRDLLYGAEQVRRQISYLGLSDRYMVWVDILLQPTQVVLVGIAIVIRFAVGVLTSIVSGGFLLGNHDYSSSHS